MRVWQCTGVPRVFDRIYAGAMTKIDEKGGLAAKLFHWGYRRKSAKLKQNIPHNKVTYSKFPAGCDLLHGIAPTRQA